MRAVKQKTTSVWIVQPTSKLNSKSKDASDLIVEAVALTKALPSTKISGSTIVKIEKLSPKEFFGKGKIAELSSIFESNKIGLVIGTTGLSKEQENIIEKNSQLSPIIYSSNMSVGVNLLFSLIDKAVKSIDNNWDIEVLEMHHRHKVDAPSGTALSMGKVAAASREYQFDKIKKLSREGKVGQRSNEEIGFATLRGGSVVGDHTMILAHEDERIELTHKATNRKIYANGAVRAAIWCSDKQKGLFSMKQVLGL